MTVDWFLIAGTFAFGGYLIGYGNGYRHACEQTLRRVKGDAVVSLPNDARLMREGYEEMAEQDRQTNEEFRHVDEEVPWPSYGGSDPGDDKRARE